MRAADERPWGLFGLAVDVPRRRLWATTAATAEVPGLAEQDRGRTALLCYDLDLGVLLRRTELDAGPGAHVLGDLTVGPDGTVYVTDSVGGGVYPCGIACGQGDIRNLDPE